MTDVILSLKDVSKTFRVGSVDVQAVDRVSLDVHQGECLAIVGESGSGKSTLGNMILGIYPPSSGSIEYRGTALPARRELQHRRAIQLVQQNPLSSLNPRRSIGASLRLALDTHHIGARADRPAHAAKLLEEVGLDHGPTDVNALGLLCTPHHQHLHDNRQVNTRNSDGTHTVRDRDTGRVIAQG